MTVVSSATHHGAAPQRTPTATVTIDTFGVHMDGRGPNDENSGSSSQISPLHHCGLKPSSQPAPETQHACLGNASPTTSSVVVSTSSANGYDQGAPRSGLAASYKGQTTGPSLTAGSASILLSSAQPVSSSWSLSSPWANVSHDYGGFGTGTAPGTNSFSSKPSGTGVSSAGPPSIDATGTSDKSWALGTAAPGSRNSTQAISGPPGPTAAPTGPIPGSWTASTGATFPSFTAAPTGPLLNDRNSSDAVSSSSGPVLSSFPAAPAESASQGPLEGSPRGDNSTGNISLGLTGSSTSSLTPSPPAAADETPSGAGVTSSSIPPVAAVPSAPYYPPSNVLQGRTSIFIQKGEIQDLTNSFAFPESPTGLYKRMWQPANPRGAGDPAASPSTTSGMFPRDPFIS